MDPQARCAALVLICAPGFLAEVGSQNVPLLTYLHPLTFLLGSLAYGVPVLLIRELSVARNLDLGGTAILGLAYGILNEGVLAKTLTQAGGPPLLDFAGYGQIGALQLGWAIFIVGWHALHSVVYPILIADWLFPRVASRSWFASGHAARYALYAALAALYLQYPLNDGTGGLPGLALYVAATAVLVAIASRRHVGPGREPARPSRPALWGAATLAFYLFSFWAPRNLPFVLFVAGTAVTICIAIVLMARARWRRLPEVLRFGLGDGLAFSGFAAVIAIANDRHPIEAVAAGVVFVVIFALLLRAVSRQPSGRGETPTSAATGGTA